MSKIREIIDKVDFVDLVSKKTNLKSVKPNQYKGLSPFTNEKTPSFFLNNHSKTWYCFSSGTGGGVFEYVEKVENLDRAGAIRFLAELTDVELDDVSPEESYVKKALALAQAHFRKDVSVARNYLIERGFSDDVVDKYDIGFIGHGDGLVEHLRKNGVSDSVMVSSGLCYKDDQNGNIVASFFNRVMIPIRDAYGSIVSFTGRDISGKSSAKYKHGPLTSVFQKRNIVWNLNQARPLMTEKDMVVVCEGQMDAIAVNESGFPAVATLGTNISKEQLEQLAKYVSNIYIVFDSDSAGEKGILRASSLAQEIDIDAVVYAVVLPSKGKDPEEFLREFGAEEFAKAITESKSDTSAIVQSLIRKNYKEGITKAAMARKVLYELKDTLFKRTFTYRSLDLIERVSQEFSFSQKELMKWLDTKPAIVSTRATTFVDMSFPAPVYERRILLAVLNEPILINKVIDDTIRLIDFESQLVNKILSYCKPSYDSSEYFDVLRDNLEEEEYYKTLEMFSLGIGDIDLESALQVMRSKVSARQSNLAHRNFLGRPVSNDPSYRSTVREIIKSEERINLDEYE